MKRNMTNLPRLTMAVSALLFALLAMAPPKSSAAVEIFLTINPNTGGSQPTAISTAREIYNAIVMMAPTFLP